MYFGASGGFLLSWANPAVHLIWSARARFPHPLQDIKPKPKKTAIISQLVLLPQTPRMSTQPLTPLPTPPGLSACICNCLASLVTESRPIRSSPECNITFSVSINSMRTYIMHRGHLVPSEWCTDELVRTWRSSGRRSSADGECCKICHT